MDKKRFHKIFGRRLRMHEKALSSNLKNEKKLHQKLMNLYSNTFDSAPLPLPSVNVNVKVG